MWDRQEKEFLPKVLGLESHTFNIGNAKYAAEYQKTVDAIANKISKRSTREGKRLQRQSET
jgi:hypothetical protein